MSATLRRDRATGGTSLVEIQHTPNASLVDSDCRTGHISNVGRKSDPEGG